MVTKPELRRAVANGYIKASDYNYNFEQLNNYIENGVADNAINNYEADREFSKGQWVLANTSEGKGLYESQVDGNKGNSLLDTTYWKKLILGGALNLFDTVLKDHVLTYAESKGLALQGTYVYKEAVAGSRYGYPDFYNKVVEEYAEAKALGVQRLTRDGKSIKMYIHPNGHMYYNATDSKITDQIDDWFNTFGTAWFYGLDTTNERVFLPRQNLLNITDKSILPVAGNGMTLGLNDVTNGNCGLRMLNAYFCPHPDGYGVPAGTKITTNGGFKEGYTYGITTDSTKSGIESRLTDFKEENKYLYICVGNTESQSVITDVVDVTTTENDTIPLGYHFYQAGAQPSLSYVKSQSQWNDGNIYTTFYNEFVNKIGQAFASGYVKNYTEEYSDYDLVINQDDITFRLPLLDGSENLPSNKYESLTFVNKGEYTAVKNGWYQLVVQSSEAYGFITIENKTSKIKDFTRNQNQTSYSFSVSVYAKKGDVIYTEVAGTATLSSFTFTEAQGNGSLYFKVANAVQNLELLDVGEVLEALADKISRQDCKAYIVETYVNGTSGYRVWSDKYCEQWGLSSYPATVSLLKNYKDTKWNIVATIATNSTKAQYENITCIDKTVSSFYLDQAGRGVSNSAYWRACGYIA